MKYAVTVNDWGIAATVFNFVEDNLDEPGYLSLTGNTITFGQPAFDFLAAECGEEWIRIDAAEDITCLRVDAAAYAVRLAP